MWTSKCCKGNDSQNQSELLLQPAYRHENTDPLLVSLTLLQTHNAQMILERAPQNSALLDSEIIRSQARSKSQKAWALERLNSLGDDAPTTIRRLTSNTRSRQNTQKSETSNINYHSHPTASETNDVKTANHPEASQGNIVIHQLASSGKHLIPNNKKRDRLSATTLSSSHIENKAGPTLLNVDQVPSAQDISSSSLKQPEANCPRPIMKDATTANPYSRIPMLHAPHLQLQDVPMKALKNKHAYGLREHLTPKKRKCNKDPDWSAMNIDDPISPTLTLQAQEVPMKAINNKNTYGLREHLTPKKRNCKNDPDLGQHTMNIDDPISPTPELSRELNNLKPETVVTEATLFRFDTSEYVGDVLHNRDETGTKKL